MVWSRNPVGVQRPGCLANDEANAFAGVLKGRPQARVAWGVRQFVLARRGP